MDRTNELLPLPDAAPMEPAPEHDYSSLAQVSGMASLASQLAGEFSDAEKDRRDHEERWLDDLRQYRGLYAETVRDKMDAGRSQLFLNITKQKVDSTKARLMSLLFPSTSEDNWSIQPTPEPDMSPEAVQAEQLAAAREQRPPRDARELAKEAAERMSRAIADQLAETQGRPNYRASCGAVIHQGLLHGTGILKGPLVNFRKRRRLARDPQTGLYGLYDVPSEELAPYFEVVSIWDAYPDASTTDPEAMRYVWQTHVMDARELLEGLASMPLFDAEAIRDYVSAHPDGDWTPRWWEQELRSLSLAESGARAALSAHGRFRVYERWGQLTGRQLRDAGLDIPDGELRIYDAQVWMLGDRIIKIAPQPVAGFGLPYQLFYYHKDQTSLWGEGLAWTLRDVQNAVNASIRLLLDNAAITSGPIIGINVSALAEGEDPSNLYPWKIFQFAGAQDMREAMTLWQMQSNTPEILRIYDLLMKSADEMSVPRYMAGDNTSLRGAGETASGLSMLMNAANLTIQDLVRSFDDGITQPFIRSLYLWNMIFNPDESIKGDYDVVAVGSSSLLAKEAEGQRLMQAMQIFQAPQFAGRIKEEELLKDFLQKFNLPDHILRSGDEFKRWQTAQAQEAAAVQAQAAVEAVVRELARQGVPPEQTAQQIMALAAQTVQAAQGGDEGQMPEAMPALGVGEAGTAA